MEFFSTLLLTLANRFDDPDEIRDISTYGISGGFSGFIYSTELCEFFDRFEDEIADELEDMCITLSDLVEDESRWTFQEIKEKSVWIVVEAYCHRRVDEMDEIIEEANALEMV